MIRYVIKIRDYQSDPSYSVFFSITNITQTLWL
jgi:hypothetical protein